jgi:hypothetical protein
MAARVGESKILVALRRQVTPNSLAADAVRCASASRVLPSFVADRAAEVQVG